MKHLTRYASLLPAMALSTIAFAQTTTTTTSATPPKRTEPKSNVQITSDTSKVHRCRDTDVKSADGTTPAQTSTEDRLEKAGADCQKAPAKAKAPK